jgi:hypothetical protein
VIACEALPRAAPRGSSYRPSAKWRIRKRLFPPAQAAEFMADALEFHKPHPPFLYVPLPRSSPPDRSPFGWENGMGRLKTSFSDTGRLSTSVGDTVVGRHAVVEHKGLSATMPRISSYPPPFEHDALSSTKRPVVPLVILADGLSE